MRTRMEIANSDFIKRLATCAARRVVEPAVIVAEERETADQAKQRAIAYYMGGFHRNEIESVLEDSGFTDVDIEEAMTDLERYAEEMSKDGPFSTLEPGQLVKLNKASTSGVLLDKRKDFIEIQLDDMAVRVNAADVDFRSTAELTQAFQLRREASAKLQRVAEIDYDLESVSAPTNDVQEELTCGLATATRELSVLAREIEQETATNTVAAMNSEVCAHLRGFAERLASLQQRIEAKRYTDDSFCKDMLKWATTQPADIKNKVLNAVEEVSTASTQNSFKAAQEYFNSWENDIKPELTRQMQQVDQFIAQDEALEQAAQAQVAVAAILKRYK